LTGDDFTDTAIFLDPSHPAEDPSHRIMRQVLLAVIEQQDMRVVQPNTIFLNYDYMYQDCIGILSRISGYPITFFSVLQTIPGICIAGGAAYKSLPIVDYNSVLYPQSDIDLWIYGETDEDREQTFRQLVSYIDQVCPESFYACAHGNLTVITTFGCTLQVIYTNETRPEGLLCKFDMDHVQVGLITSEQRVIISIKAVLAFLTKTTYMYSYSIPRAYKAHELGYRVKTIFGGSISSEKLENYKQSNLYIDYNFNYIVHPNVIHPEESLTEEDKNRTIFLIKKIMNLTSVTTSAQTVVDNFNYFDNGIENYAKHRIHYLDFSHEVNHDIAARYRALPNTKQSIILHIKLPVLPGVITRKETIIELSDISGLNPRNNERILRFIRDVTKGKIQGYEDIKAHTPRFIHSGSGNIEPCSKFIGQQDYIQATLVLFLLDNYKPVMRFGRIDVYNRNLTC